jgi:hypothetical protein
MNILIEHNHDVIHYIVDMIPDQYYRIAQLNKFFNNLIVKEKREKWMAYRIQYRKIRNVLYKKLNERKEYEFTVKNTNIINVYDIIPILVNNLKYVKNIKNFNGNILLRIYPNEYFKTLEIIWKYCNKPFDMMNIRLDSGWNSIDMNTMIMMF